MFQTNITKADERMTISISGRIDSANASQAEKEMTDAIAGFSGELILDAANLEYISSAGLRVILRLKKTNDTTRIINASTEIYEIFDITGFTEMMDIVKAYRKLSVDGCEVIGEGANGKVYRIDADTIVKLYKNHDALEEIHRERELARKAFVMGIPTAIPYDVVQVGELYGSVFELLNATSFAKLLIANPEQTEKYAKASVDTLKTIHSTLLKRGELPDKKAQILERSELCKDYLPADVGEKLMRMIREIPDTLNILHGDYHIKNIMQQNNETLLIDMDSLSMGHPIFEFSSIFLAYVGFSCIDHNNVKEFLGIPYEQAGRFWRATLKYYFDTQDEEKLREIENKAAILGYAYILQRTVRKSTDSEEMKAKMIDYCQKTLTALVHQVDSLSF